MSINNGKNILFAGEGGQGVQKIAQALNLAASKQHQSTYINSFGVEQRGTPSSAFIIISDNDIAYPRFSHADICLIMNARSIPVAEKYISANTEIVFDSSTIDHSDLTKISHKKYGLPATKYAFDKFDKRSYNIILYGVITKIVGLDEKVSWGAILNVLGKKFKTQEAIDLNHEAFIFGREATLEKNNYSTAEFQTKKGLTIIKNSKKKAVIMPTRCKGCLICVLKCPVKAIMVGTDLGVFSTPIPEIDIEKCIACGNCRSFCPDGAIGVDKIN